MRPLAITAMAELGIDISRQESKTFDRYPGQPFDAVITVCDQANEACPVFRGAARRLHWRFPDPSKATGTEEEQLALLVEGPEDNGHLAECTGSGAGFDSSARTVDAENRSLRDERGDVLLVGCSPPPRSCPFTSASVRCVCDPAAQGRALLPRQAHHCRPHALAARILLGGVRHVVALTKLVHRHTHERGLVEEDIVPPGVRPNEAEPALADRFDRALCHGSSPSSGAIKKQQGLVCLITIPDLSLTGREQVLALPARLRTLDSARIPHTATRP